MQIQNNPAQLRYEVLDDGGSVAGFAAYRNRAGSRIFVHTEVDDAYAGQGVAARLARYAVEDVRDAGLRLVPYCPYIAGWLKRHPEYGGIVDWPAAEPSVTDPVGQA
ncbi:N-acetyltransferase [Arthrobacter sp. Sa2CUA1]|uniref:N-acetyltransferase n=1 Tax=Arthrobacter gallicola TaxID=2762225 RepID=A0ABR8UPP2_9MICC|nr:GNAT family N-acetyltransferase [Arthrobacter gallicola]MBD7994509.1 N-acetyltransferase [Arthrobacter gallicola]